MRMVSPCCRPCKGGTLLSREDVIDRVPHFGFARHEWAVNASDGKADGNFAGEGLVDLCRPTTAVVFGMKLMRDVEFHGGGRHR